MKAFDLQLIERWAPDLRGVYAMSDLKVLFGMQSEAALYKKLQAFVAEGILVKVKRGLYAKPDASLRDVASSIVPDAYISLGTILAEQAIIGSMPDRRVQAVRVGRPRCFSCSLGTVEFLSISPKLYFGFITESGIRCATPEKAFLDACYFTFKGRQLSFDIDTDVDRSRLDQQRIAEWLPKYDRRFVTFYQRMTGDG